MSSLVLASPGTRCRSIAEETLRNAIDAHLRWKDGLENYVFGVGDEHLTLEAVAADDQCHPGKWIHGPGCDCFGQLEVFRDLFAAHAEFHHHAAGILTSMQRSNLADATERLQVGDYPRASTAVKVLLARLYVEILCDRTHRSFPSASRHS